MCLAKAIRTWLTQNHAPKLWINSEGSFRTSVWLSAFSQKKGILLSPSKERNV